MGEGFEVLSALLDGETVEIAHLETALEDPRGRHTLVDFVRLRQETRGDDTSPRAEFYRRIQKEVRVPRAVMSRRIPVPLAAAAVLVAWLVGSLLTSGVFNVSPRLAQPPEATRVLRFEPGVDWQQ